MARRNFKCPMPGCIKRGTTKGGMLQHARAVHPGVPVDHYERALRLGTEVHLVQPPKRVRRENLQLAFGLLGIVACLILLARIFLTWNH